VRILDDSNDEVLVLSRSWKKGSAPDWVSQYNDVIKERRSNLEVDPDFGYKKDVFKRDLGNLIKLLSENAKDEAGKERKYTESELSKELNVSLGFMPYFIEKAEYEKIIRKVSKDVYVKEPTFK